MDALIKQAAGAIGVHDDLLRIAFCLVASFPVCSLLKRIPLKNLALKELVIFGVGLFYLVGLFQLYLGTLLLVASGLFTYGLAKLAPSRRIMPICNFAVQMTMLLVVHCTEQFGDADFVNNIGISGSQMIMLQKFTSYGWDVYDGTCATDQLTDHQKEARIVQIPSLLRYFAWLFFFPTVLTGPTCTLNEFSAWLDMSMFTELKTVNGEPLKRAPRSGVKLLLKITEGLFWVFVYTQFGNVFPDPEVYKYDWYLGLPWVRRVLVVYVIQMLYRTKYYSAWILSEAACIHSGISFNGVNQRSGKLNWDRMNNVRPMAVETAQNFHGVFGNWNIITSKWLRHYVYLRVTPAGQRPGTTSTFITFFTSALWHGTRSGYYLTFIFAAVYQTFGKVFRRNLRPIFLGTSLKWVYDCVGIVVTQLTLSFCVMPFLVLNLQPTLQIWTSLYFYPFVGLVVSWLLLLGPLAPIVRPRLRLLSRDLKKVE